MGYRIGELAEVDIVKAPQYQERPAEVDE